MNKADIVHQDEWCQAYAAYNCGSDNQGSAVYFGCPSRNRCARFSAVKISQKRIGECLNREDLLIHNEVAKMFENVRLSNS